MPTRRLPRTTEERYNALRNAKTKAENTPGQTVIQAATVTTMDAAETELKGLIQAENTALEAQTELTGKVEPSFMSTKMWYSHIIQHLNDAIARKDAGFKPSIRAFYGIHINDDTVPEVVTHDDMKTLGQKLIDGEAARIAAGGIAMSFPSVADFQLLQFKPFNDNLIAQSTAKDAFDNAQEAIAGKNAGYDVLIKRIWNEIELAFSAESASSKRRKAREWGVVYIGVKGDKVTLDVPAASTVTPDFDVEDDMHFSGKNTGTVPIILCRGSVAGVACTAGVTINPGVTLSFTSADLGADGEFMNVTNNDAGIDGQIQISIL